MSCSGNISFVFLRPPAAEIWLSLVRRNVGFFFMWSNETLRLLCSLWETRTGSDVMLKDLVGCEAFPVSCHSNSFSFCSSTISSSGCDAFTDPLLSSSAFPLFSPVFLRRMSEKRDVQTFGNYRIYVFIGGKTDQNQNPVDQTAEKN